MMKLLITARDPATALSFEKLIPELLESGRFELRVLCQEPAFQMLQPFVPADTLYAIPKDEFALVLEDAFLRNQFESFQPDAVLTGISGPDTGIDEAVLHYAATHDIHSYALQSFWGDMNQASGALPDTAFVMDDEAIRITHERYPDIENVAIGSIKHIDYRAYDPLKARAEKRPGLVESDEVVLGNFMANRYWRLPVISRPLKRSPVNFPTGRARLNYCTVRTRKKRRNCKRKPCRCSPKHLVTEFLWIRFWRLRTVWWCVIWY